MISLDKGGVAPRSRWNLDALTEQDLISVWNTLVLECEDSLSLAAPLMVHRLIPPEFDLVFDEATPWEIAEAMEGIDLRDRYFFVVDRRWTSGNFRRALRRVIDFGAYHDDDIAAAARDCGITLGARA